MFSQKIFNNNSCYISGLKRTGKSLLIAILPSVKKIGLINKDPSLSLISAMYINNEISYKSARYLIRFIESNINYSNFIGRKINLKKSDETSIYKLQNYRKYLKKISKKKYKINENIKDDHISFYDIHNILSNLDFWKKTNENFKLINVERNPVDLAYSWYQNKLGKYSKSSINQLLVYEFNKLLVPFYAKKWKAKFLRMKELDRIIEILYQEITISNFNYRKKNNKKKILKLKYENIILNPQKSLKKINTFLNIKSSINLNKYKKEININKLVSNHMRLKKIKFIKKKCSDLYFKKLIKLENEYNV